MKPSDPSLGPAFLPPPLPSLIEAIEARLGLITLVDLTFPRCHLLAQHHPDLRVGLVVNTRPATERAFLQTMRQRGGHAAIALVDEDGFGATDDLVDLSAPGQMPVFFVDGIETARRLASAAEETARAFLFPVAAPDHSPGKRGRSHIAKFDLTCISEESDGRGFWLATPRKVGDSSESALIVVETLAAHPDERIIIPARHLLHDGGYTAEGDEAYSWLWTGPSHHFRMVVPRPEHDSVRRIELSIVRTESIENLTALVMQVDGRPVKHFFEPWSDNSGKVIVELSSPADYTILSLIVPKLDTDKNSGRTLGVCLDKLILLSERDSE